MHIYIYIYIYIYINNRLTAQISAHEGHKIEPVKLVPFTVIVNDICMCVCVYIYIGLIKYK